MKKFFLLLFIVSSLSVFGQIQKKYNYEQLAINFFTDSIYNSFKKTRIITEGKIYLKEYNSLSDIDYILSNHYLSFSQKTNNQ